MSINMRERPALAGDDAKRFLAEEKRVDTSRQEQIIRTLEAEVLRLQRLNQLAESARGEAEQGRRVDRLYMQLQRGLEV